MNPLTILVFVFIIWAIGKWIFDSLLNSDIDNEEEKKECYKCGKKINYAYKNKCPHCLAPIVPHQIKEKLDALRILKNILLVWRDKNRISIDEYERLNKIHEEDRKTIIDRIEKYSLEEKHVDSALNQNFPEKKPSPPIVPKATNQPVRETPKSTKDESSLPLEETNKNVTPPKVFDSKTVAKPEMKSIEELNKTTKEKSLSGFLNARSIKLMLYVGASLFILGTSIFVKNYWDIIPGNIKFASLLFVTIVTYFAGYLLLKKNKIPKTANTLLFLGSLLIPYNFFAVNNFALLGPIRDWQIIWLLASFVCLPLYIFNYLVLKKRLFIYASLTVYTIMTYLTADLMKLPERFFPLLFIVFILLLPIMLAKYLKHKNRSNFEKTIFDLHIFSNVIGIILLIYLLNFIEIMLTHGSINALTVLNCLLLTIFYIMDSFLVEKPIILYFAGISYYLGILFFASRFNPTLLKYITAFSFGALLSELIINSLKTPFENTNYFKPLLIINYSLMIIISIGIFSIEIVNSIGQYLLNFNISQFLNYQNWDIFWISIIAIGYLFLLQKRKKQSIYTYFLLGYSYSLVFSLMQSMLPISYHGFGFIFLGISGILIEERLEKKDFDVTLILPIKYFSHIFMFLIVVYTLIKYVMDLVIPDDYVLVVFRLSGLFLFYSIWFYLHRNNPLIYLLSFLYYFIFIILTVNILSFTQHSLILSIATIPLLLLHLNIRTQDYGMHLLIILSFVYSLAFYISTINGFYVYPQIATDIGLELFAL